MKHRLISALIILALASLACSFNIDLGEAPAPGPEVVDEITVPGPGAGETRLSLVFGAGELYLSPGAQGLVEGTATYNIEDFKPEVDTDDDEVRIRQGAYEFAAAPTLRTLKNIWDLQLGDSDIDLDIQAGAYQGRMELGGLSLTGLTVHDGASDVELAFSEPNRTDMSMLRYETGASNVTLQGLANANFGTMIFRSGAGNYTLDFSGELQRDATITINSGLGNMTLIVPEGIDAVVTVDGGLSNVSAGPAWTRDGDAYVQEGSGPTQTYVVTMSAGNLSLTD
jgi:hypothetical protein